MGEVWEIQRGGAAHPIPQLTAKCCQLVSVGGEARGDGDVLSGIARDELCQPGVGADADAGAADGGLAGEGDDGDAHPESVEGGGASGAGEGVEGDVDVAEGLVVLLDGAEWGEADQGGIDAVTAEGVDDVLAV